MAADAGTDENVPCQGGGVTIRRISYLSACPACGRPFSRLVPPSCPKCGKVFTAAERSAAPTARTPHNDPDNYEEALSAASWSFRGAGTVAGLLIMLAWIVAILGLIGSAVIGDAVAGSSTSSNAATVGLAVGLGGAVEVLICAGLLAAAGYSVRLQHGIWREVWSSNY